jgi:DNA-binding PadR family transcriptional regulator
MFELVVVGCTLLSGPDAMAESIYNTIQARRATTFGELYTALDRLEQKGFVNGAYRASTSRERPRKIVYRYGVRARGVSARARSA